MPAKLAVIQENACIGCTKCIQACPVDAIIGAAKQMHTVINDECIGCGLCVSPCPVDCIEMIEIAQTTERKQQIAKKAQQRFRARKLRLAKQQQTVAVTQDMLNDEIKAAIMRAKK